MVGHVKHSNICREAIEDFQRREGISNPLTVLQDVPTRFVSFFCLSRTHLRLVIVLRWNSVFLMLERALKLKAALESALYPDPKTRVLLPDEKAWQTAHELVTILRPFLQATEIFSGSTYVTSSVVFPVYLRLKDAVEEQMKNYTATAPFHKLLVLFKADLDALLADLTDFFKKASLLDTRFFPMWQQDRLKSERQRLVDDLRKQLREEELKAKGISASTGKDSKQHSESKESKERDPHQGSSSSSADTGFVLFPEMPVAAPAEPTEDELARFLREPALPMKVSPLTHWAEVLSAKYPVLARIAKRLFSVVASSVPSERLFSHVGELISDIRASLDPALAEQQVFVMQNKDILLARIINQHGDKGKKAKS